MRTGEESLTVLIGEEADLNDAFIVAEKDALEIGWNGESSVANDELTPTEANHDVESDSVKVDILEFSAPLA